MTFKSAIDLWLALLVIGTPLLVLAIVIPNLINSGQLNTVTTVGVGLVVVIPVLFPLWLFAATHYTIGEKNLDIVSGPFRWQVPIEHIHNLADSRSLLSSPALSLDRLKITYGESGQKAVMISPRDKPLFVEKLKAHPNYRPGN